MKTSDVEMLEDYEETAKLGMKAVREFLIYQGDNSKYLSRAKIGAMAMGAYTRLRATRANEKALVLAAKRQMGGSANASVPALPEPVRSDTETPQWGAPSTVLRS